MGDERIRVLVCDDHKMFVQGLVSLLEQEPGIEVVGTASTAQEAFDVVVREGPDVVLLDQVLPDENGITVLRRIKEHRPETGVVIVTSLVDDDLVMLALEAGSAGYLTKDKAIQDIVHAVRAVHEGEALIPPQVLGRVLSKIQGEHAPAGTDLTDRECEVLELLAEGISNADIADRLGLSIHTVRNHVQSVITKMRANSKLQAVVFAIRDGLVKAGGAPA